MRYLLAAILLAISWLPANAQSNTFLIVGSVQSALCPMGVSLPDGCLGANAASVFQVPTAFSSGGLFNTLAGTSTNYSTTNIGTVGVNAAGVHYPVANFTPTASLLDPATSAPAACSHGTTAAGNPLLNCSPTSSAGLVISGLDFSARFGHACTVLEYDTKLGPVTITNNNFKNDGNCGFSSSQEQMVFQNASVGVNFPSTITYNSFDGNGTSFPYNTCGVAIDATCNGAAATVTFGAVTMEYNSIINFAGRPLVCNWAGTPASMTIKYNYIQGWDYHPFNGHTEFVVCNGQNATGSAFDVEYNTVVQTTDAMQFGPVPIFASSVGPVDIGAVTVIGNTVISSLVGGSTATATASGCVGGTSACNTPGTNFYASSVSGSDRIGHGEALGGAEGGPVCVVPSGTLTVTSITAMAVSGFAGSGGTSTVAISATSPALIVGNTITMPAPSGYGTVAMPIISIPTGGGAGNYLVFNPNTSSGTFSGSAAATTTGGTATVTAISTPTGSSTMTVTGSPTIGLGGNSNNTVTMSSGYGTNPMTITKILTGIGGAGTYTVTNTNTGSFSGSATATTPGGNISAWLATNLGGGQGSGSSWTIDSGGAPAGLWLTGPATCTNLLMFGASQNVALFEANGFRNVGATILTGNYIDSLSTLIFSHTGASIAWGGSASITLTCATPGVVSANVDMAGFASSGILNPNLSGAPFSTGC